MFERYIGNEICLKILSRLIENKKFPKFSLFYGTGGTGKSAVSEEIGAALSNNVIKFNIARMKEKKDINSIIDEIFKYKKEETTVYILEEMHKMSEEEQSSLLEEFSKLDDYVIMNTTEFYSIIPELRSRAFQFKFQEPTRTQCKDFFKGTAIGDPNLINLIIKKARCNPRDILNLIKLFSDSQVFLIDEVKKFLNICSEEELMECLKACNGNSYEFKEFLDKDRLDDIIENLRDFSVDIMAVYYGSSTNISRAVKEDIEKFIEGKGERFVLGLANHIATIPYKCNASSELIKLRRFLKDINNYKDVFMKSEQLEDTVNRSEIMQAKKDAELEASEEDIERILGTVSKFTPTSKDEQLEQILSSIEGSF